MFMWKQTYIVPFHCHYLVDTDQDLSLLALHKSEHGVYSIKYNSQKYKEQMGHTKQHMLTFYNQISNIIENASSYSLSQYLLFIFIFFLDIM